MPLADLWPTFEPAWIVHEDADLIVLDKPEGLATHPPEPGRTDDVHSRLAAFLREEGRDPYLGIHQRLDRETSGVLLFTRRKEANAAIASQFEGRSVQKTYVAIVEGKLAPEGELRHRLVPGEGGTMKVLPPNARAGQEAITRYRVLERRGRRSLLEVRPETGRTHQIRAQLGAIGAPIVGDPRYGGPPAARLYLHAGALTLEHPHSRKARTFRAAPSPEFRQGLAEASPLELGDATAVEKALREAATKRWSLGRDPNTTGFRLANEAGDGLPGLTVDVVGDFLVLSLLSEEALAARETLLDAAWALGPTGVYLKLRPKHASRIVDTRREEVAPREALRGQSAPEAFTMMEGGLPYEVRLGDGLSFGIFLDQRENRRRVRELSAGLRVLNLFAYTGAFTVAAAAGGAVQTCTVDVSRTVLAWARRNFDRLQLDSAAHALVEADVLGWLQSRPANERYDLILLDPPSFSTTKSSRWSAESDYRTLAAQAFGLLAPGGRLLACTNHRGIPRLKLRRQLHEAARSAGRIVTQMKDLPDPVDFPPSPGQECHLKAILVTVEAPESPAFSPAAKSSRGPRSPKALADSKGRPLAEARRGPRRR